jgi:CheY-like chemotaxis protein/anti-sigma regulatory factor (Ser/Thr protein kinase)
VTESDDRRKREAVADPHRDLAGVLHDVSNALTVLLGWIGETKGPEATPETIAYALKIIEQRAKIARDLARHAIGAPSFDEHEQRQAARIANEVVETLRVEASRRAATLVVRDVDVEARLDGAIDVSQVLTNLILNALAHAPSGTEVVVEVTEDEEQVSFVVADQGPGVPQSRRDGIFRGDSLRPGGAGVGLRHSRALARARGGEVELLAPTPAGGASFRLTWPRVDATPRAPARTTQASELDGVRILLIEDDAAVSQLLETALEVRGADVTIASNEAEVAKALTSGPFDAGLLDLSPIANDIAGAIARLKACSPDIDLVLITGSADRLPDVIASEGMKLVRKPFELAEVLAVLAKKH